VHLGYEPTNPPGYCNFDLPNDSVYNRFLFVVNLFARNGARLPPVSALRRQQH